MMDKDSYLELLITSYDAPVGQLDRRICHTSMCSQGLRSTGGSLDEALLPCTVVSGHTNLEDISQIGKVSYRLGSGKCQLMFRPSTDRLDMPFSR
jgi:hypothetical protein